MKIKITKRIPVEPQHQPVVGGVYEVVQEQVGRSYEGTPHFVEVNGQRVGVWRTECEVVTDADED